MKDPIAYNMECRRTMMVLYGGMKQYIVSEEGLFWIMNLCLGRFIFLFELILFYILLGLGILMVWFQ